MKSFKKKCSTQIGLLLFMMTGVFCVGCQKQQTVNEIQPTRVTGLEVNSSVNPLAVEKQNISFNWRWESTQQGKQQTAYEILVAEDETALQEKDYVWDSGKTEGNASAYISYEGPQLNAATKYYWKVNAWDEKGNCYSSMETAFFMTSPDDKDWENSFWISAPQNKYSIDGYSSFTVDFDCQTQNSTVSFLYGVKTDEYDPHIRWELDASGEKVVYNLYNMSEDNKIIKELDIFSNQLVEQESHITLEVKDSQLTTYLNGEKIASDEITATALGGFGFYQGRNYQSSFYDNLVITADDHIVFQENFEQPKQSIFAPKHVRIQNGRLEARHEYILTNTQDTPAPVFMKSFEVQKEIKEAFFYGTSLGIYDGSINGKSIGNAFFTPGRQSYMSQMKYDAFDITESVKAGKNEIQLTLGHGWFDRAGYEGEGPLGVRAQIVLFYQDGSKEVIGTDESWECYTNGPIRKDDMYDGEFYDANFSLSDQQSAEPVVLHQIASKYAQLPLVPNDVEKMEQIQILTPLAVTEPEEGTFVYDFGQEFTGIVKIDGLQGKQGACVTFSFGESLNEAGMENRDDITGTVWQDNLLMAENRNYYVFGSQEEVSYQPHLVCTAFRYMQVEGVTQAPALEQVQGIVISSALEQTGKFSCSNEKINQLYENINWTQLSNYLDVPTDCPQRDERFGWAGDAQAFARSASYNRDTCHFMNQYLDYLREGQEENGAYPDVAPYLQGGSGNNGWADAGVTITWYQYLQYGDKSVIEKNMPAMLKYIDYLVNTSDQYVRNTGGFGDHNSVTETPMEIINTALCANSAKLVSRMASIIGNKQEAARAGEIAECFKQAWQQNFVNEDGSIDCWTQAAYTLGLAFDLFSEEQKVQAANNLATCVNYADRHLNTGYIATPFLLPELTKTGHADLASAVLLQESYPSWLYLVNHGATTIHEKWNSIEQRTQDTYAVQGSLNHYGLGSVNEYFFRYLLGIEADEDKPGFQHFFLQPTVIEGLTYAKGSYQSIYGMIESAWEKDENGVVTYTFSIPANTTATLRLPGQEDMMLTSGIYHFGGSHME